MAYTPELAMYSSPPFERPLDGSAKNGLSKGVVSLEGKVELHIGGCGPQTIVHVHVATCAIVYNTCASTYIILHSALNSKTKLHVHVQRERKRERERKTKSRSTVVLLS